MADIQIEAGAYNKLHEVASRGGPFWTSPTVGYVIYVEDSFYDLYYRKTVDGGANWAAGVWLVDGNIFKFDCFADWQVAGDTGTKIHIAYQDAEAKAVRYMYLDTNDDTFGGDVEVEACQGSGNFRANTARQHNFISITKTRGGNLAIALRYADHLFAQFYGFYTSPDASTWNSKNSPWEDYPLDYCALFTGNEVDNQDIWAVFYDDTAEAISLKTYDDSENSWSEQAIASSIKFPTGTYLQHDGCIRLSDGHLIFAAWNKWDDAASVLQTWDINGAGSIVAKANVITDTAEYFAVSVFVNQVNDDIYIAYVGGAVAESTVAAQYQLSQDGGGNWDGEVQIQANADDDERWISAGAVKAAWGGKFQPVWFNDDDNDIFCNTDNGVSIAAAVAVSYKDIATRFKLWVKSFKDIATRFKLTVRGYLDVSTRFKLFVQNYLDIATRFKLNVQGYSDIASRFKLWVQNYTNIAIRFRLVVQNYSDIATRFKLIKYYFKDVSTRFRLAMPGVYTNIGTRFLLHVPDWRVFAEEVALLKAEVAALEEAAEPKAHFRI